ncbi:DnaB-like helicase N-terminal domain-containing protein [Williamsia muralis]|uniref:DnaB-like helicase N-terminal domain-containing protein n=1 Tax=Williamsia marianensis TaxID=85044 RepID=A0ABU4F0S6_WILMA|nr:DnaB-like helicase N-terminal domain-containing protein [Williamsia muralis]MDV7137107.1 DnaB-like helicase N-terminal domain-containing protein [Williamsia muralis]
MTITATDMATDIESAGALTPDNEVLTVDQFPSRLGVDVSTEDAITTSVEAAFLTALMWAPKDFAQQVRTVMSGPDRWNPFWSPAHAEIFDAVSSVLDEGGPATPVLVQARLYETGRLPRVEQHLFTILSPTQGPLIGGVELPHLAAKVIDQWYRRGYAGLLARMSQIRETVSVEELAGHWESLTGHQQRAEELWLTKRDQLARLHQGPA